jgi:hypothetical protein
MTFINKTYSKSPFQTIEVGITTSDDVSDELTWESSNYNNGITSANQKYLINRRYEASPLFNNILDIITNSNGTKTFFNGSNTYIKASGELYTAGTADYGTTQQNIQNTVSHSVSEISANYTKKIYTLFRVQ